MPRQLNGRRFYCHSAAETLIGPADVLVIGGGAAGCFAALEAAKLGLQVVLVDKGIVGRSGSTPTSQAGTAVYLPGAEPAPGAEGESAELYFENIVGVGERMNDPRLVRLFVEEATRRLLDTVELGVDYVKTADGRIRQHRTMGHNRPRTTVPVGDGRMVMSALRRELLHRGVRLVERTAVTRLLQAEGRVSGALGLDIDTGEARLLPASAVVLAGGSATGLFPYQSASFLTTGDAWVLGYQAGARLANMEFLEFTIIPKAGRTVIPASGISPYLAFGGKLYDRQGERILRRYDPALMEHTSRATIVYAVYTELLAGRGPITNDPADFGEQEWREVGDIAKRLAAAGLDYRRAKFEWVPALHTCLGGMIIDEDAWTGVPGLWAAGECASTIHGANRLSSCSIPDCYVFGYRAGRAAARFARATEAPAWPTDDQARGEVDRLRAAYGEAGESPREVLKQVRQTAWTYLGLRRDEAGLRQGLEEMAALRRLPLAVTDVASLVRAWEIEHLLLSGELIGRAALARTESRGQHRRADHPSRDDERWLRWVVLQRGEGGVQVATTPIPELASLRQAS